ncbi:hypothetical protein BS17DRAFT_785042 [Gyrodon lividus]|nr:hypothetical protein BS17DRAFT_785042 [Gyrodon lividus]
MPSLFSSTFSNRLFSSEPQRALLTPSASPSVGPPDRSPPAKRPRLAGTPSSSTSATPSAPNDLTTPADVHSARRASTLRVLNVWAQLAERYNKRLDEDDIVDLYSGAIVKDRGVLKGAGRDYNIGHFAQTDDDQEDPDVDQDQEDSEQDVEQDDDKYELNTLPPRETTADDDPPISKKELLRGVPPLSATTDAEDLRDFLEAEKRRRELAGNEEDYGDDMSQEALTVLRKALAERSRKKEAAAAAVADVTPTEVPEENEVSVTPTRDSTRSLPSDDESEDELGIWARDESTAVHPIARNESEQDIFEVEQKVIELTDSDSDEEFEAILTRPPRPVKLSPPKQFQQPLQLCLDRRGRSKSRIRVCSKPKSGMRSKSKSRPARSPISTLSCSPSRSPPATPPTITSALSSQFMHSPLLKKQQTPIPSFKHQQSPQPQLHTPPRSSSLIDLPQDTCDYVPFTTTSWEELRAPSPRNQAHSDNQIQPQPESSAPLKRRAKTPSLSSPKATPKSNPKVKAVPLDALQQCRATPRSPSLSSQPSTSQTKPRAKSKPPKLKDDSGSKATRKAIPEVLITHKRKAPVREKSTVSASDTEEEGEQDKGKDKEIICQQRESYRETTFKPLGVTSRGLKRKRIASSAAENEQNSSFQSHVRSTSRSSVKAPQPNGPTTSLGNNWFTPGRSGPAVAGPSRSFSSFSSASTPLQFPASTYRPFDHGVIPPPSHGYDYNTTPLADPALPLPRLHHQRHLSHPPHVYPPANQGTSGSLLPGHPLPPIDLIQTQQAHYLLAQAMHQLSYLMSATMPSYDAYTSSPGQPRQHQLPSSAYGTPVHAPTHPHGARPYHTPSSSVSHSTLPPSSPVQSSVSPPVEEHRAWSQARSKSRGRRVSFKLDNEGSGDRDDDINTEDVGEQRPRKQTQETRKGKGKTVEVSNNPSRLEDRGSPPRRDISRGQTPGPPCRDECHAPRGRSVSRR